LFGGDDCNLEIELDFRMDMGINHVLC